MKILSKFMLTVATLIMFVSINAYAATVPATTLIQLSVEKKQLLVTSSDLKRVSLEAYNNHRYALSITLTPQAGEKLGDLTQNNIGKSLVIKIMDSVVSTPTIESSLGHSFLLTGVTSKQGLFILDSQLKNNSH